MPGGRRQRPHRQVRSQYQIRHEEQAITTDDEEEEQLVEPSTSRGGQRTSHIDEEAAV